MSIADVVETFLILLLVLSLFLVGCSSSSSPKIIGAVVSVDALGDCSDSNLWEDKCVGTHLYTCSGTGGAWVDVGEDLGYCPGDVQ